MARKVKRTLLAAVALSLAVHLLLLGYAGRFGFTPGAELDFPIEASLAPLEPVPPPPPPRRHRVQAAPTAEQPVPAPVPEPAPASESLPEAPPAATLADAAPAQAAAPAETAPAQAEAPDTGDGPARPIRAAVRNLADAFVARYSVQTGEGSSGFVAGRATYIWQSRDGHYTLVSTLEATGLASLFISGRIVQVSEGALDGAGLHPTQYHLQRNERKQDVARFNWSQKRLTLEDRPSIGLTEQAQDLLSFPFHLAMTAREGEPDFQLGVTNGRKFNDFTFRVLGRETVEVAGTPVDALHVRGEKAGEGSLDVWLDTARAGLPVRVRTLDRKGKVAVMQLLGVDAPARQGSGD
ncbi:DUF3108 domain-containing protein [Parasulfuritortus cantonensis]|uniref:DUF3108 domain-containing protein n=1 Tax=Parasulfuritortus cantonensis TaxID=2528202 RepID=A0A4R1BIF2_9PROT|nr:DUF3108 domain-containing protein [Parasulfuritortus cantonensis]TCJ17095.1 DUF3108 domain-containing protein [Parasulfuritortus cantonensis]